MQHGKLCLKPVKFFLQSKIYGVETTIESSKIHFQSICSRQKFWYSALQKQTLGHSKKVGQKTGLLLRWYNKASTWSRLWIALVCPIFLHFHFSHFETFWNINGTQSVLIKLVSNLYFSIQASSISSIFCRKAPLANGLAGTLFFQVSFYGHFFNLKIRAFSLFNFYLVHVSMKHFFKLKLCWVKKMEEGNFFCPLWFVLIELNSINVQNVTNEEAKKSNLRRF